MFLKTSQSSQKNTYVAVFFFNKVAGLYFEEHLRTAAFALAYTKSTQEIFPALIKPFKRKRHKTVKLFLPTNCLSVFDRFV